MLKEFRGKIPQDPTTGDWTQQPVSNSSEILYPLQFVYINTFFPKLRILIISFCIAAVVEQKPPKQGGVRLRESQFSAWFFIHLGNSTLYYGFLAIEL